MIEYGSIPLNSRRDEDPSEYRRGFVTAFLGCTAFTAPMLIMTIDPSLKKSLITACSFIVIVAFGLLGAWVCVRPHGVLLITAAYAAVLVVFVGWCLWV